MKEFITIVRIVILCLCSCNLLACSDNTKNDIDSDDGYPATTKIKLTFDKKTVLNNPMNGWVAYVNRGAAAGFWARYDNIDVPDLGKTVKLTDYAGVAYFRTSWSSLNPQEGVYVWDDPGAALTQNIQEALNRGMRLAFRVVIDGRDQGLNTPQYVFDAGAEWFPDPDGSNGANRKSPYPDDPIFQQKYAKFIEAFAAKYNDPDVVDFIDAYGLGKWGESHNVIYKNPANREAVFEWITDLYSTQFDKVPLLINYHRVIGINSSWGAADPDSERLLRSAISKGYSLRHDAFGMNGYYQQWEKDFAAAWQFKVPIVMEGGWIVSGHSYWNDPAGYRKGHPEDVRQGEFDASAEAHVNMMDFRAGSETLSWFQKSYSLVERFIAEGGYRLYPDEISVPEAVTPGDEVKITHRWNNMGWGYCPTNIRQWNQKYKVGFALLDAQDNVLKVIVDDQTDLSTWLKGTPTTYDLITPISDVPAGEYTWAVAIVDKTKDNIPGIKIAVSNSVLSSGWVKLKKVVIK